MSALILIGDGRAMMGQLPAGCVQCVVTSPPYWGLRSYLAADDPNKGLEIGQEPTIGAYVGKTWWTCSAASGGCCTRPALCSEPRRRVREHRRHPGRVEA